MLLRLSRASALARGSPVWSSYAEISRFVRATRLLSLSKSPDTRWDRTGRISQMHARGFTTSRKNADTERPGPSLEFLEKFKSSFDFPSATHQIRDLTKDSIGREVVLHGYLGDRSDLSKKLSFCTLYDKDLRRHIQIISLAKGADEQENPAHVALKSLDVQTPVAVRGTLKAKKPGKNDAEHVDRITDVELELAEIFELNEFPKDIIITKDTVFPPEKRNLQLRNDRSLRDALAFRAKATNICRDELCKQDFLEIETPLLFKSTPEGAREFLVPTRAKGLAYALPQSPQQYKQILMASGIPKYFQVAKCFRDEDLRADRQPEFTQLDLEMSFAKGRDVQAVIEALLRRLWKDLLNIDLPETFPRMPYQEAMAKYGSDKPDTRLGMEIQRIEYLLPVDLISKIGPLTDPIVELFRFKVSDDPRTTRDFVLKFMDSPAAIPFLTNPSGQPGFSIYDSSKPLSGLQPFGFEATEVLEATLSLEDGDLIVLQARPNALFSGGSTPIGNLRLALHKFAVATGLIDPPQGFSFLWIQDFPLFSPTTEQDPGQGGSAGLSSTHHPFTAPKTAADVDLLRTDPAAVTAEHYDIVVNGVELGGGSRRIHDARVQEYVLRDVLRMAPERVEDFRHLLEVLRAGCPPHAGIALGFDRLVAVMLGRESVRDVIAFPKSGAGEDLLVKSPNRATREQWETYHLVVKG